MFKFCYILILCWILQSSLVKSGNIFVTPHKSCGLSCSGTASNPYDNLLIALDKVSSISSVTIFLLYDSTTPHYILNKEYTNSLMTSLQYDISGNTHLFVNNIIITPLFCDNPLVVPNQPLASQCLNPGDKITVYMKTTKFTVGILSSLQIQNVIFDASEDISLFNSQSNTQFLNCLYNRVRCCPNGVPSSGLSVKCTSSGDYSSTLPQSSSSLFSLVNSDILDYTSVSLSLQDTNFINSISSDLTSLIMTGHNPFHLKILNSVVDRVYFYRGLVFHTAGVNLANLKSSEISFEDISFTNYNPTNLQRTATLDSEGYLLMISDCFSGTISIKTSKFISATDALRSKCPSLVVGDYFKRPMNNILIEKSTQFTPFATSDYSRSDLWSQVDIDHLGRPTSSLIFIKQFSGSLTVESSTFQNIIGSSGSVIHIEDTSDNTQFSITGSTFDNNFSYRGFSNLFIVRSSNIRFATMLSCPILSIASSVFTNAYGCPGSHGNNLYLCYWDTSPPRTTTTLFSDDLSGYDCSQQYIRAYTTLSTYGIHSFVSVKDCQFMNNIASVSNSLAIIGSPYTDLEGNLFQHNGGSTAEIILARLSSSYVNTNYPDKLSYSEIKSNVHFGQSTVVFLDRVMLFNSANNQYKNNWGSWEGSLALAESLTIKNWIPMQNSIKFLSDLYTNHQGIPQDVGYKLSDSSLANNVYMSPLITVSYDLLGYIQLWLYQHVLSDFGTNSYDKLNIFNITFSDNTLSYDASHYTYNSDRTQYIFSSYSSSLPIQLSTGLIKFLTVAEKLDLTSALSFKNTDTGLRAGVYIADSLISGNKLLTSGCLFATQWTRSFSFYNTQFISNKILDVSLDVSASNEGPDLTRIDSLAKGLICAIYSEVFVSTVLSVLTLDTVKAQGNTGVLLFSAPNNYIPITIQNSVINQSTCLEAGLISIYNSGNIKLTNNVFSGNLNSLGNIFLYKNVYYSATNTNYLANKGIHATLVFALKTDKSSVSEHSTTAIANNNASPYKAFKDLQTPQGALYYFSFSTVAIYDSVFKENSCYSGVFNSISSTITVQTCTFSGNQITGTSIIGSFLSGSSLTMKYSNIINSSLSKDKTIAMNQQAVLLLYASNFLGRNNIFSNISLSGGANLIFGDTTSINLSVMTLENIATINVIAVPLLWFIVSDITIQKLKSRNNVNIFQLDKSRMSLSNSAVMNTLTTNGTQYLLRTSSSKALFNKLIYSEDYSSTIPTSLIQGDGSNIQITASSFTSMKLKPSTIISVTQGSSAYIIHSSFQYLEESKAINVFEFAQSDQIVVDSCIFIFAGQIIGAQNTVNDLRFTNNIAIVNSLVQSLTIEEGNAAIINNNCFLGKNETKHLVVAASADITTAQIKLKDALGAISISENIFISLYGQLGAVSIQSQQYQYNANISSNVFIDNQGSMGAGIYFSVDQKWTDTIGTKNYPQAIIQSSIFVLNNATYSNQIGLASGKGGAIYQSSTSSTHQDTTVTKSIFINNTAYSNGGAIFFDFSPPSIDQANTFISNYATQLNHIGSYAVRVVPFWQTPSSNITYIPGQTHPVQLQQPLSYWADVASGIKAEEQYTFALLDMYDQVVLGDYSSTLKLYPYGLSSDDIYVFSPISSITAQNGLYYYEDFTLTFKTNSKINVTFLTNAIKIPDTTATTSQITTANSTVVEVDFRQCTFGEYLIKSGVFTKCQECQAGYWSVGKNDLDPKQGCTECDHTSTLCLGGSKVGPKPGYWRMNKTSNIVTACNNADACIGNDVNMDYSIHKIDPTGKCTAQFQGNLCDKCTSGYGKISDTKCVSCKTSVWQYAKLYLSLAVQIVLLIYGIKQVVDEAKKFAISCDKSGAEETDAAILIRILFNYLQMTTLIQQVPIAWPSVLKQSLSTNVNFSFSKGVALSYDCFFQMGKAITSIPEVFLRTLLTVLTPFAFVFLSLLFWILWFKLRGKSISNNKNFSNQVITTILVICFNLQPNVLTSCFELFQCVNLYRDDTPITFLIMDYDIQCWTSEHMSMVYFIGIPGVLFWGLGLPIFTYYVLRTNIDKLETVEFKMRYSFLYVGYKQDRCFWELIIMLRKLLMVCIIVFAGNYSVNLQLYLCVILSSLSFIAQKYNMPYSDENLNDLEVVSLISACMINYCGLYFGTAGGVAALDIIVLSIGLFGSFYFLLKFAKLFIAVKKESLKQNVYFMAVFNKLCFCCKSKGLQKFIKRVEGRISRGQTMIEDLLRVIAGTQKIRSNQIKSCDLGNASIPIDYRARAARIKFEHTLTMNDTSPLKLGTTDWSKFRTQNTEDTFMASDETKRTLGLQMGVNYPTYDAMINRRARIKQLISFQTLRE